MYTMKILHSADWHLDSPMQGHTPAQQELLRGKLLEIPGKIAALCAQEKCDLVLLAGDLFDGSYTQRSYKAVYEALEQMKVPVFVTPGNHDHLGGGSPWEKELWPDNVHIFTRPQVESVALAQLDCRVYGAGFIEKDCPSLLEGFYAQQQEKYAIGVFHGDPTQVSSPYNPITTLQVSRSGLDYLALGHIHKGDAFRAGDTLCAWPGCPMGTGYDELGIKGVLIVEVADTVNQRFIPLDAPRFYDLEVQAGSDPAKALEQVLPGAASEDFYRITFVGESESIDLDELRQLFVRFPNLTLRDKTTAPVDLWASAGEDSFEGMYFGLLKQQLESAVDEEERAKIALAAKLSRLILSGEEVALP